MTGRSNSILFVLAATLSISGISTSEANGQLADSGSPNILIIIADDLGWSDVGYNGSDVQTPNIDLPREKAGSRIIYPAILSESHSA